MTNRLTSADTIGEAADRIRADWPANRFLDLKRLVLDTLHDCQVLADAHEDAARLRAKAQPSLFPMMAEMFPSRAVANPDARTQCHASVANQCDGCARGLAINANGNHVDAGGHPVQGCTAHLYAADEPARLRTGGAL